MVGNSWKSWPIVNIFSEEGNYGIEENSLNGFAKSTVSVLYELEEFFIGKDPYDIERITQDMYRRIESREVKSTKVLLVLLK